MTREQKVDMAVKRVFERYPPSVMEDFYCRLRNSRGWDLDRERVAEIRITYRMLEKFV